ncbi:mannosyltransferase family protein [Corynebacterium felinum]|uniref:Mannosyltransferase (PIG-V) n=1 Tax=Corynebacterium felinum TaxID=131318 RepID=A0ABU2B788_9CORY|nr:mannosyltransferase family protein [Corynebacterium felinum]MDF5821148.1 mannosyltransferase family protein [Corynebacterium felinum]MDR7354474.1 hypothetical protein [Corynebacterium felinum]WJY93843.1 Mannosyltransferase (PIG-V) [Corynebacterium felinum]
MAKDYHPLPPFLTTSKGNSAVHTKTHSGDNTTAPPAAGTAPQLAQEIIPALAASTRPPIAAGAHALRLPTWTPTPFGARDWLLALTLSIVTAIARSLGVWVATGFAPNIGRQLRQWDAIHFAEIAKYGYFSTQGYGADNPEIYQTRLAFFPGLPALMRALNELTGINVYAAGEILSLIATFFIAAGAIKLASLLGAPLSGKIGAALLFLCAPMSITFQMAYTEAIFIAISLWAMAMLLEGRWCATALLIFIAGFFRLTTIDLIATFAIIALLYAPHNLRDRRTWLIWGSVIASALPLLGYIWWASSHTRDIGGYFGLQEKGWHSSFDFGAATLRWTVQELISGTQPGYFISIASIIGAVSAVFFSFRRLPWALWLCGATIVANVVLSDGIMHSRPRLLLLGLVLLLPLVIQTPKRLPPITYGLMIGAWSVAGIVTSSYMLVIFDWAI